MDKRTRIKQIICRCLLVYTCFYFAVRIFASFTGGEAREGFVFVSKGIIYLGWPLWWIGFLKVSFQGKYALLWEILAKIGMGVACVFVLSGVFMLSVLFGFSEKVTEWSKSGNYVIVRRDSFLGYSSDVEYYKIYAGILRYPSERGTVLGAYLEEKYEEPFAFDEKTGKWIPESHPEIRILMDSYLGTIYGDNYEEAVVDWYLWQVAESGDFTTLQYSEEDYGYVMNITEAPSGTVALEAGSLIEMMLKDSFFSKNSGCIPMVVYASDGYHYCRYLPFGEMSDSEMEEYGVKAEYYHDAAYLEDYVRKQQAEMLELAR